MGNNKEENIQKSARRNRNNHVDLEVKKMKCPKAKVKGRTSKTGKGNPSDHRTSIRGHTWKITDDRLYRFCVNCNKRIKRLKGRGEQLDNKP